MTDNLVLTLGHGSSAILIRDNKIINGYQNERLSRKKSDSQFPELAIREIEKFDKINDMINVYISHWEPGGNISNLSYKHCDLSYFRDRYDTAIVTTGLGISHHDAHAYSALAYIGNEIESNSHVIVADGFGNFGEVISIYKVEDNKPVCIFRSFGYLGSLGLWYQYATDFCGFKMNQDEWKLNALAANVEDTVPLEPIVNLLYEEITSHISASVLNLDDPLLNLGALPYVHNHVHGFLSNHFKKENAPEIAYVLQVAIRRVLVELIRTFKIKNLILAGGSFMNVQLNGELSSHVDSICIMPLSGDSGAGLGLYKAFNPEFVIPNDLSWGKRDMDISSNSMMGKGFHKYGKTFLFTQDLQQDLIDLLVTDKIINVVRSTMEFGERAYCNTSTIALPSKKNSEYISKINGRSSFMPTCPVINEFILESLFQLECKIIKSVEHMIIALEYDYTWDDMMGVTFFTADHQYTGRPQVVGPDHYMYDVLNYFGILINTSFNVHGEPIVYTLEDAWNSHVYQKDIDSQNRVITLIEV